MKSPLLVLALSAAVAAKSHAQDTTTVRTMGDSITIRFVDAELRIAVQALGRFLDRPVLMAGVPATRVTLETPRPIARADVVPLLRGLVESQNLDLVMDTAFYRIRQREPAAPQARPVAGNQAMTELTVVRLRHARAIDVAATLSSLYGAGNGELTAPGRPGTLSDELRRNIVPPPNATGAQRGVAPTGGNSGPAQLESAITVVPDPFTNALLIRATAHDADLLRQAIDVLDSRPLQVLIEVLIVEARRDRQLAYGLDVTLSATKVGERTTTVQATQTGGGLGDFAVHVMSLGHPDIELLLRAGVSSGDVQILSRPVLLAANNQEARFLVGSQRPFVQVSYSLPNATAGRDQVVQYKDVGTRLAVRPTISSDGYVTLDVTQEVSNATNETAFDAPVISTREASTQVLVRDGQTIVLGGLTDHESDVTGGGLPFLSELPVIGGLFGRHSRHSSETELFLFLTPRVLRTDEEVNRATEDYQSRVPSSVLPATSTPDPRP